MLIIIAFNPKFINAGNVKEMADRLADKPITRYNYIQIIPHYDDDAPPIFITSTNNPLMGGLNSDAQAL